MSAPGARKRVIRPLSVVPSEYVETQNGNRISKRSRVQGASYIVLGGKSTIESGAAVRGDLHRADSKTIIAIGRYCYLGKDCSIVPPHRKAGEKTYYPVKIGSYVQIGEGTMCEAASIGNCVVIGRNCTIGKFAIIKDCVKIADDTVIPPYAVVAPFSAVSGVPPGQVINELPESAEDVLELDARRIYSGIELNERPFEPLQ
ncbi:hypothetical protein TRVA0_020S02190 [Trichomonascus vanleenenianus]|uniref:dynactin subunit 5 n=1 Tax=Trichomonascus vanleenenianus TaxID=2268995 RepID=UPI003EC9ECE4